MLHNMTLKRVVLLQRPLLFQNHVVKHCILLEHWTQKGMRCTYRVKSGTVLHSVRTRQPSLCVRHCSLQDHVISCPESDTKEGCIVRYKSASANLPIYASLFVPDSEQDAILDSMILKRAGGH